MSGAAIEGDWFVRHADTRNPDAFINTNPAYFAEECAAAIISGRLSAIATAQPVDTEGLVEAVAKIINPIGFRSWDAMVAHCLRSGDDEETARRYADASYGEQCSVARTAARAAISALSPRMDDVRREALEEAAKVADERAEAARMAGVQGGIDPIEAQILDEHISDIAAAIRALTKGSSDTRPPADRGVG